MNYTVKITEDTGNGSVERSGIVERFSATVDDLDIGHVIAAVYYKPRVRAPRKDKGGTHKTTGGAA